MNSVDDDRYVETYFGEGALGVTLRRSPDGIVFVHEIVPNSQAVDLDVIPGDELWAVGESEIGTTPLDKDAWNGLITFIKQSSRPLRFVWRRKFPEMNCAATSETLTPSSPQPVTRSPEFFDLERLVTRFVNRDKETYKKIFMIDPAQVLREGRRILRQGDLLVESRLFSQANNSNVSSLWSKVGSATRRVILCNDLIMVAVLLGGNMLALEYILEIQTCKLRSLGHLFSPSQDFNVTGSSKDALLCSFEVLYPGGELHFVAENAAEKNVWALNIYHVLCANFDKGGHVLGWRHQLMLGTMHSAVIHRDEDRLRELIALCEERKLDFLAIESPDEDGYTPLHYACMLRLRSIVKILHEASADVTCADRLGLTPLHWAALQLDEFSLSLLCTHVFDIDLHDKFDRTPLVVACIEGRDLSGKTDPVLLKSCVDRMLLHKPSLHFADNMNQTLLHFLAASWQFDAMDSLLAAGCAEINATDNRYFMTPLHYAARGTPIKRAVGEATLIMNKGGGMESLDSDGDAECVLEELNHPHGAETLRTLLKHGARPNFKDVQGRTPLMILLEDDVEQRWTRSELEAAISVMLSHGARVDDVTNPVNNPNGSVGDLLKRKHFDLNVSAFIQKWNLLPALDCTKLDLRLNHFETVLEEDSSSSSRKDKSLAVNCNMCGFSFTLFRRQHHCRLCNLSVCDECSKKRVFVEDVQVRCCDTCYNRVLNVQKKVNQEELSKIIQAPNDKTAFSAPGRSKSDAINVDAAKKSLLQNSSGKVDKTSDRSVSSTSTSRGLWGTSSALSEAHEQLQQRGEKLSRLSERTGELSNQASEFARLARQLNEQKKSSWF